MTNFNSYNRIDNPVDECSPLIVSGIVYTNSEQEIDDSLNIDETSTRNEAKVMGLNAAPLLLTFLLQYSVEFIAIIMAGRLGKDELAAISLAFMIFSITGNTVIIGMASCLDTVCAQAYGAGQKKLVGHYFQKCAAIIFIFLIPVSFSWWYSYDILKYLVPQKELALLSQQFLRIMIVGAPGIILFETGKRYLQAQGIFDAGFYVLLMSLPINFFLNYFFVYHGLGYVGSAIGLAATLWIMPILLLIYVKLKISDECWDGLSFQVMFSNWGPLLSLALPGMLMTIAEFFAFELVTLFSAQFGTSSLAANSIGANTAMCAFCLPYAVSISASNRIANFIGAQRVKSAKLSIRAAFYMAWIIGLITFSLLTIFREYVARIFTSDEEVIEIAKTIIPIIGLNNIFDGFNVVTSGCLRGQGRQKVGSILALIAYYGLAIPCSYIGGFVLDYKVAGLWGGIMVGIVSLSAMQGVVTLKGDWDWILATASLRNQL